MNTMDKYEFLLHSDHSSHKWADVEFNNVAMELLKEKKHKEAETLLKKGLERNSDDFNFHEDLGTVYWSTSHFEEAEKSLQTALDRAEKELTENPDSIDEEVIIDIKTKLAKIKRKESYEKNRKNHW